MEILITNIIEPTKGSQSKQLAGYSFARCIGLTPGLPSLAGFVAENLLAVFQHWLASRKGGVLGNTAVLGTS